MPDHSKPLAALGDVTIDGVRIGTELDAVAEPKNGARVYVLFILSLEV
jgi:hypothetical protein